MLVTAGFLGFISFKTDVVSAGNIWYVGSGAGNHTASIQDAISNFSNPGDTVYVFNGTYYENVVIDKTINLTGEDKENTIINGGGSGNVVIVRSDYTNITGFTITKSGGISGQKSGIWLYYVQNCKIFKNNVSQNYNGITLSSNSHNNTISNNHIYSNSNVGIFGDDPSYKNNNIITDNRISYNYWGIWSWWSSNFTISNNKFYSNNCGIFFAYCSNFTISNNSFNLGEHHGVMLISGSNYNTIIYNSFKSNIKYGLYISSSNYNLIHHNNFIDNTYQAYDDRDNNFWDNGYPSGGNYWSDYDGIDLNSTPSQNVPPPDGIGDTPYVIDSNSKDFFPLMQPTIEPTISPLPPKLYINVSSDDRDIILYWEPQQTLIFDPYLIYRSTDPNNFDFTTPWVNTLTDKEPGESSPIPDRTMWNDTNAAFPANVTNYKEHYYYVIRAFNDLGPVSSTSRTVGKWTKTFPQGVSTFSLPLEPLQNMTIDSCLNDMNARYIKWVHPVSHRWMKHGDGVVNNTQMKLGEGYEVKFDTQTNYTFTGLPGAMISYDDDSGFLGFDPASEAKNLAVTVEPNGNVTLIWEEPASMGFGDWYEVYYSNTRDGFFGTFNVSYFLVCLPVYFGNNTTTHNGAQANNPGTRLYYIVVPFNASGFRGASTYSIGIWTEEYLQGYDTFGLPLKLDNNQTADWYCDQIPNTVGINYYNISVQRWCWHSTRMPAGAYDPVLVMTEGYQISTSGLTKFTFVGV